MSYLDTLETRRQKARDDIDAYMRGAESRGEDLNDAENAAIEELDKQVRGLDERLRPLQEQALRDAEHATRQAEVDKALAGRTRGKDQPTDETGDGSSDLLTATYRSAGAYLADWARWKKDDDPTAKNRLYRAIQHQTTSDNPGILPTPIVGPVSTLLNATRPLITSVGVRQAPAKGKTFQRPKITQHAATGPQVTEKTALTSQKLTIASNTVSKSTYGGVVNISQQDIDWTEPSIWDLVVRDLYGLLAQQTESAFGSYFNTQVSAAAGQKILLPALTDPSVVIKALYDGANLVYSGTGRMPDTLWVSPAVWAALGALSDTAKRPVFPYLGPTNAAGQMGIDSLTATPLGVRLVVTPGLTGQQMVLGIAEFAEYYEQGPAQLSVSEPELLGVQLAVYCYAAMLVTQTTAFAWYSAT